MNKKAFSKMLTIVMVALMGVSFVSCGNDAVVPPVNPLNPVNPGISSVLSSLYGSWRDAGDEYGYEIVTFNANGTGVHIYYTFVGGTYVYDGMETFTYFLDENTMILHMQFTDIDDNGLAYAYEENKPLKILSPTSISIGDWVYTRQ